MGQVITGVWSGGTSGTVITGQSTPRGAGYMGIFGTGQYQCFLNSGNFVVPDEVSSIRVRVVGGGGAGGGSGTPGGAGGTSSFGALISATGGQGGRAGTQSGTSAGGEGIGGDFQSKGGSIGTTTNSGGGAAAGSQLGDGGTSVGGAGGGVGGGDAQDCGGSAFGKGFGGVSGPDANGESFTSRQFVGTSFPSPQSLSQIRFPFELFTGCGGAICTAVVSTSLYDVPMSGGSGAGGSSVVNSGYGKPRGGIGGGGGGSTGITGTPGHGGIGGGGGGNQGYGGAGGGYAHGVFSVVEGASYAVTVGDAGLGPSGRGGPGLVVVEW